MKNEVLFFVTHTHIWKMKLFSLLHTHPHQHTLPQNNSAKTSSRISLSTFVAQCTCIKVHWSWSYNTVLFWDYLTWLYPDDTPSPRKLLLPFSSSLIFWKWIKYHTFNYRYSCKYVPAVNPKETGSIAKKDKFGTLILLHVVLWDYFLRRSLTKFQKSYSNYELQPSLCLENSPSLSTKYNVGKQWKETCNQ